MVISMPGGTHEKFVRVPPSCVIIVPCLACTNIYIKVLIKNERMSRMACCQQACLGIVCQQCGPCHGPARKSVNQMQDCAKQTCTDESS